MHNDLKLENILVGNRDSNPNSLGDIKLIDLGLNSSYLTNDGEHIAEQL